MNKIRVRIAPSPTGNLHIGTARAALFNYLFAKNKGGKFVLRIEDTDLQRSDIKFEKDIIEGLKWLGIEWDEGIIKSKSKKYWGSYGPYRQSERIKIYQKYIKKLLDENKAYHCFCTLKELEKERKEAMKNGKAPIYSGKCRNLSKDEIEKYKKEGRNSIIRFNVADEIVKYHDLIRGDMKFESKLIGDLSIARDENTPLYNFAVVIDDYTMKITHVIRGEDHISNTPKQILIQQALGFPHPEYAHLPLILGPDKSKLSKRHGDTSVIEYKNQGYLPEAMVNFMALLGWNPKDEREYFSLKSLINEFDLKKVGKSGAIFNIEKLDNINGYYIRQMSNDQYIKKCILHLTKNNIIKNIKNSQWQILKTNETVSQEYIEKSVLLEKSRIKKLSEIIEATKFLFIKDLSYDKDLLIWKNMPASEIVKNLELSKNFIKNLPDNKFSAEILEKLIKDYLEEQGISAGEFLWPLRVALSGRKNSPSPFEIAEVLGKEKVLHRISLAIDKF